MRKKRKSETYEFRAVKAPLNGLLRDDDHGRLRGRLLKDKLNELSIEVSQVRAIISLVIEQHVLDTLEQGKPDAELICAKMFSKAMT